MRNWKSFSFGGLIVFAACLVYATTIFNGFVWDDAVVIVKNQAILGSPTALFNKIDTAREIEQTPYYRPVTILSFMIEQRLHGLNPAMMHLINLLLHATASLLIYNLAESILKDKKTALLTALLFSVHPINAEGVAFISGGRNTLLSTCFVLSALLLYRSSRENNDYFRAMISSLLFLAGLFAKETALAAVPFIAALEFQPKPPATHRNWLSAISRLSLIAGVCCVYLLMRTHALSEAGVTSEFLPGIVSRITNNVYIIPRYFLTVVWPPASSIRYYVPEDLNTLALPLFAAWSLLIFIVIWLLRRGQSTATILGLSWFAVFWLPTSGIIPFPSAPMADRYLYLPAIGLWLVIADQVVRFFLNGQTTNRLGSIAAAIVLFLLGAITTTQNRVWKNDITLFSDYVNKYPDIALGHHNLGTAYLDLTHDIESADREFFKVMAINPAFPRLHTQMGYVRLLRGDYEGALQHYTEAVIQNPRDAEAFLNRGNTLIQLRRFSEAINDYKQFLTLPGNELAEARPLAASKIQELESFTLR